MRGATAVASSSVIGKREFQSTRPMRGATLGSILAANTQIISIHAPHAGRDARVDAHILESIISIHAPHAGRDVEGERLAAEFLYFNPRAPCGARQSRKGRSSSHTGFQSTRPMRGATKLYEIIDGLFGISIHAPHAGRDSRRLFAVSSTTAFQSTRPMRGATERLEKPYRPGAISIHAPHAGRDDTSSNHTSFGLISIHAPHAGRDVNDFDVDSDTLKFQSTRPMRGATRNREYPEAKL